MTNMFVHSTLLVKVGDKCDICNVTNMGYMFNNTTSFNH